MYFKVLKGLVQCSATVLYWYTGSRLVYTYMYMYRAIIATCSCILIYGRGDVLVYIYFTLLPGIIYLVQYLAAVYLRQIIIYI